MKKLYLLGITMLFAFTMSYAQFSVTTNGGSGLAASYSSLADAITALNGATISSPVVITCPAGTETNPAGGYSITASGTAANTITIQGAGASSVITAPSPAGTVGNLNDAIFKIIGGDYITIQGFSLNENAANTATTAASNNMVEWGVALLYATTTNGAQNCTIQNNTITLNRIYQNTFGIYSNSTHSATAVTTSATATTSAGGNSGLKIYGNTISNVNNGVIVIGPTAAADMNTGIDVGGTGGTQTNSITNFGTTGTFSAYANVSGTVNGVLVRNSIGYNVSYNTLTSSVGGVTSGTLNGIQAPSFSNAPTGTFTTNVNNNTISLKSGSATGAMNGINLSGTSATTTSSINVNNNNFTDWGHSVAASGTITFITQIGTHLNVNITGNTFTNLSVNTTGSVTFFSHSYTMPAAGIQTISNNSIVTAFNKTGAGGTITISTSGSSSPNGSSHVFTNNNFSNITVTGATTIIGVSNTDGAGTSPNRTVTGNTFNNWTGGTSAITGMSYSYIGATSSISNNTFTNISGQSSITAITIGNTFAGGNPLTIANNTINNLTSSGTGGTVVGISTSSASPLVNINNNAISSLSSTAGSPVNGLVVSGGTAVNVFKNNICNILGSSASSTANGILVSSGTTVTLSNNRIADLRTPAANAANPLIGINVSGGTTVNAYFNTVYLNGTSSGALFGSSAISASTSPTLTLNNNIFVNSSTTTGAGVAVAYRRSTATLTTYGATSNRNDFFASTIYTDGTTPQVTLAAYKTLVGPTRDANSVSENPTFQSVACGNTNFLKIDLTIPTQLESGGSNISGITDDFEGDIRQGNSGYPGTGTAPDIGADEGNFTPLPLCSGTPVGGTIPTLSSNQSVCPSSPVLTLTAVGASADPGITYQWEESADLAFTAPINAVGGTGATTISYSPPNTPASFTAPIYYRLKVTCTVSSLIAYSNVATISPPQSPSVQASNIIFSNINPNSITSTWTNGNGAKRFAVINSVNSFVDPINGTTGPGTANTVYGGTGQQVVFDGTANTVTVTGLTCGQTYYLRVYEYLVCGTDYYYNVSTATTNPNSVAAASPYTATGSFPQAVNFTGFTGSNLNTVFAGWNEGAGTTTPVGITSAWTSATFGSGPQGTTALINLYTTSRIEWIISPIVTLPAAPSRVSFKYAITDFFSTTAADATGIQGTDDKVGLYISSDAGCTWTLLNEINSTTAIPNPSSITFTTVEVNIPATYSNQNVLIGFKATDGPVDNTNDYDFHIDDVSIELVPSCLAPSALTNTSVTLTSASHSWTAPTPTPAVGYEWAVTTSATPPASGTATTGTTASSTGLSSNTTYYLHVRSDCGSGSFSAWATSGSFYTGYCTPAPTSVDGSGITNVTFGELPNVVNNTTVAESGNYGNYSSLIGNVPIGSAHNINITYQTGFTYDTKIWIDFNNNLVFTDPGEEVYSGASTNANPTTLVASITIPAATTPGNYRMRIGGQDVGPTVPCYTGTYGSFEDYTVNAIAASCLTPTALSATNITSNSVDLSWTPPTTTASGYKYVFSTSNTVPTVAGTLVTIPSVSLTGLTSATVYYLFVRSICSATDSSSWAGPLAVFLPCEASNIPYLADITDVSCLSLINNNAGTTWGIQNTSPTTPTGFTAPLLQYSYSVTLPGDDYIFTRGLNLTSGTNYKLKYKFANNSTLYVEKMDVRIGNATTVAAQSTILKDHPNINNGILRLDSVIFTVPSSGVYYISFRAYSIANQFNLYLDDIAVTLDAPPCSTVVSATNSIADATTCAIAGMGLVTFDPALTTVTLAGPLNIPVNETVTYMGVMGVPVIELNSNSNFITVAATGGAIFDGVTLKDLAPSPITSPVIVNNGMVTLNNTNVVGTSPTTEVKVQNNTGASLNALGNSSIKNQ